jgi:isoleucyl-tRNA synthetase
MQLREEVFKALELIRSEKLINKNFEATVEVMLNPEYAALSQIADLKTIFIVSELNFVNEIREPLVSGKIGKIKAFKHEGLKCARC